MQKLIALLLMCCALSATAQPVARQFPMGAQIGTITPTSPSSAQIDGKDYRLAPGFRVLDTQNHNTPLQNVNNATTVRYRLDLYGQLLTVWILSDAERPT